MSSEAVLSKVTAVTEAFKHYLKLAIELNVFYYAITGAIVSYYLAHSSVPLMRRALLLPFWMSVLFATLFGAGALLNIESRREIFRVRDALGLKGAPEFAVLSALLWILALLMLGVAIGLGVLMWCQDAI
jgi:hypothetical protein